MTNPEKMLLMSIRPEHACNILNRTKTLEIRKVIPKWALKELHNGNQVKCLIYVIKNSPFARYDEGIKQYALFAKTDSSINGTIPFMITFNSVEDLTYVIGWGKLQPEFDDRDIAKRACLTVRRLHDYTQLEDCFALHISSVHIFDTPMQLSDTFFTRGKYLSDYKKLVLDPCGNYVIEEKSIKKFQPLTRAPQNCMTIYKEKTI